MNKENKKKEDLYINILKNYPNFPEFAILLKNLQIIQQMNLLKLFVNLLHTLEDKPKGFQIKDNLEIIQK